MPASRSEGKRRWLSQFDPAVSPARTRFTKSSSVPAVPVIHQRQKIIPRVLAIPESTQHSSVHCARLLACAHRASSCRSAWRHRSLPRQQGRPLPGLSAPIPASTAPESVDVARTYNDPRNLTQADHLLRWQIGHAYPPEEQQHMVFAQAEELMSFTTTIASYFTSYNAPLTIRWTSIR